MPLDNAEYVQSTRAALHDCLLANLRATHQSQAEQVCEQLTALVRRLHELVCFDDSIWCFDSMIRSAGIAPQRAAGAPAAQPQQQRDADERAPAARPLHGALQRRRLLIQYCYRTTPNYGW